METKARIGQKNNKLEESTVEIGKEFPKQCIIWPKKKH
jgi:hypothetical protein